MDSFMMCCQHFDVALVTQVQRSHIWLKKKNTTAQNFFKFKSAKIYVILKRRAIVHKNELQGVVDTNHNIFFCGETLI